MSTHSDSNPADVNAESAYGRLSDGKTAAARDVHVRLGLTGLEILETSGALARRWSYDSLETAEPLTAYAIDALLTSTAEPGMTLFVADSAFARELPSHAPQLTARATRWRHARPWIAGAAAAVVGTIALFILDISPSRAVANLLPDYARTALGADALRSMTAGRRVCHTPEGDKALERLAGRLAGASQGVKFKVVIVDWDLFNAFAVPGEQIVLTRGLLAKAETPDEVAGVLAHEMGHAIARDPETGFVRALGLSAVAQLLTGGSGGTLANIGLVLAQISYTREAEHKADLKAVQLLKDASISPIGFAGFFKRVLELEGKSETGLPGIFRTHPATEEREQLATSQPAYPSTPSLSGNDWFSLKSICDKDPGTGKPSRDEGTMAGEDI
jgi:Zn-dependent protease with chaperone function